MSVESVANQAARMMGREKVIVFTAKVSDGEVDCDLVVDGFPTEDMPKAMWHFNQMMTNKDSFQFEQQDQEAGP